MSETPTERVCLIGRNLEALAPTVVAAGLEIVDTEPQVIITYGGDGTLIGTEREHPGLIKLPIRDEPADCKCEEHRDERVLRALRAGTLNRTILPKLEVRFETLRRLALNDVILRNALLTNGVRFRLQLIEKGREGPWTDPIIGDGLVIATPLGSTAYFRSITRSVFRSGIGIGFNNTTDSTYHLVVDPDTEIRIEITRGPALLSEDNDPRFIPLEAGNRLEVKMSNESAHILCLEALQCTACRQLRE